MDMPLAVAQLGHVQEHLQELQWNLSSPMELQYELNKSSLSSSPSRCCLIHEFGDMLLAVAQLGNVQEHPQELQWTSSSPVELQ